jgi:hypothetical protein
LKKAVHEKSGSQPHASGEDNLLQLILESCTSEKGESSFDPSRRSQSRYNSTDPIGISSNVLQVSFFQECVALSASSRVRLFSPETDDGFSLHEFMNTFQIAGKMA